jgi:hypothetical protein
MERIPVNTGAVDWSGENPGMYLKESAEGPFVTLISFFRVVRSPLGRGHAAFLLLDPQGEGKDPKRPNLCVTDNDRLARYLKDQFVACFGAFRGVAGLANVRFESGSNYLASGDALRSYTETFRGAGGEVRLRWEGLGDTFFVEMPKDKSATGRHEMFSLFVNAAGVQVSINGRGVAGRPFPRDVAGKASSTAFLAFSETWVRR